MVANYQHPTELNPFKRYRQARAIHRASSRAVNDGWFTSPLELDFQIHLRLEDREATTWIYRRKDQSWSRGPKVSEEILEEPEQATEMVADLVSQAEEEHHLAIGFVIYLADEFATTEIKPELDNPGALSDLRDQIVIDPASVLDDDSLSADDHSWRLIPYPAAGSEAIATAVTLSKRDQAFVDALRDYGIANNFPVQTLSASAPLIALLALPYCYPDPSPNGFVVALPFNQFTTLAFFNEHGDLKLLRALQHRGQTRPTNLRNAAATTAASLEMDKPDVLILPFADSLDPLIEQDLKLVFPESTIQHIDWPTTFPDINDHPGLYPEMKIASLIEDEPEAPLAQSETFQALSKESWAVQDFLPMEIEAAEVFPSRQGMKILRITDLLRALLFAATVGLLLWIGHGVYDKTKQQAWQFDENSSLQVKQRLTMLTKQKQKIEHWDNLLADRSKGWVTMEMLARFFPEKSGFLISSFDYTINLDRAEGKQSIGYVRQWDISGYVQPDALRTLTKLNTREGIQAAFDKVAKATGSEAYATGLPTRSLVVNIRTVENSKYRPVDPALTVMSDTSAYPVQFDLTIKQRFESDDPLALKTTPAP